MTLQTSDESSRLARVAYFKSIPGLIEEKSREQAAANKSDPFTYARVRAHYENGVVLEPSDYSVEWGREIREASLNGQKVQFAVAVPRNMKRP